MAEAKSRQKYDLGAAVDKELVFDFPYLVHEETVSYILQHGKVMFIIRGPPSTGKTILREMIQEKYPDSAFCCADQYFENTFDSPVRNKYTLKASHIFCQKKATSACKNEVPRIIVQNTHMRKWEMQPYLNLAALYNYTVIMAITLYRFNVTPEALLSCSTDGLNLQYFQRRLLQWEDNPPYVTGWFLGESDTSYLQILAFKSVQNLIGDAKFCRVFDIYDAGKIENQFQGKKVAFCIAGYSANKSLMKEYYLSPDVQDVYGKCFKITILGYHVTTTNLNAIVKVEDEMKPLVLQDTNKKFGDHIDRLTYMMNDLQFDSNMLKFNQRCAFVERSTENCSAYTEDWDEDEDIDTLQCSFICLAQREEGCSNFRLGMVPDDPFHIENIMKEFKESLKSAGDDNNKIGNASYTELENNTKTCRLERNGWLIKADQKIVIKTIFTGFYP